MKLVSFDLYWKYGIINVKEIQQKLITKRFGFEANCVILNDDYSLDEGLEEIGKLDFEYEDHISMIISGELKQRLYFNIQNWGRHKLIKVAINCLVKDAFDVSLLKEYLGISNLICCFIYDTDDERWQSEENLNQYELVGKDHENLRKTKDRVGRTVIDTSLNFGRSKQSIGIKFIACSEMYLGDLFFKIVPRQHLINAGRVVNDVAIGANKLLHIFLYDLFSTKLSDIREAQERFLLDSKLFQVADDLKENYRSIEIALSMLGI